MLIIGFTGTRSGMTDLQKEATKNALIAIGPKFVIHGGCIGADEDFHRIAKEFGIHIKVYPGHSAKNGDTSFHFDYSDSDDIRESKSYFERNRYIVNDCNILLGAPYSQVETGGTWYTINYARKQNKQVIIL